MKMLKFKRFITTAVILLAAYLLQSTVFSHLELAGIKPNLLLIVTAAFGFMRGPKEGMWIGLAAGLLLDVQCGDIIGFYGLIYLLVGALNGLFEQLFFDEDIEPVSYIEEHGLKIVEDTGLLNDILQKIMDENPGPLAELLGGKEKVFGFFVGKMMRELKGKASPDAVREALVKEVEKRKNQ